MLQTKRTGILRDYRSIMRGSVIRGLHFLTLNLTLN